MRRPADQAKLLFLYFLRSSSALASEPIKSATLKTIPSVLDGHISLRVARRSDIPHIQRCNLATLPENYNSNFYMHHIRSWPELALVMEHVPKENKEKKIKKVSPFSSYDPNEKKKAKVVGYVLGKVEETLAFSSPKLTPSKVMEDDGFVKDYTPRNGTTRSTEMLGHVTSLAIMNQYRRRGLANHLMNQLHHHMKERYNADAVGLHVRVSNDAAARLYVDGMGYKIADVIKGYYQDGEDAYMMRKDLHEDEEEEEEEERTNGQTGGTVLGRGWFSGLGGSAGNWQPGNGMELPRKIPLVDKPVIDTVTSGSPMTVQEQQQQVITGTLQ